MKKKILIVDDSALMRRVMSDIIESDDRFEVKDFARDGVEGLELIEKNKDYYDAVILDINMPRMDGLEVLDRLQKKNISVKIVLVSTIAKEGAKETIIALEKGVFDFVTKPENYFEVKSEKFKNKLINTLALATGIKSTNESSGIQLNEIHGKTKCIGKTQGGNKLVALVCSTGGPKSLKEVIPKIPENLDAPMIMVQHMPKGFTASLAARLNEISSIRVKEAQDGDVLEKGTVYLAPGGRHMKVGCDKSGAYCIKLSDEPAVGGLRPCGDLMYESLCGTKYSEIVCVVMTGMGADGTKGIGQLCKTNNVYVIAQDEATSVVYGMPRVVVEVGLSDEIVPLDKIADTITKNVGVLSDGR